MRHYTSIGPESFEYCSKLTNIVIPSSITTIGVQAFGTSGLTSVTIPGSVTDMELNAFFNCTRLTSIIIANGVTSIGYGAFEDCTSLTSVTIPGSVTNFGEYTFQYCTNLTSVYFQGNAPPDSGSAFNEDPNTIVYYLPGTTGWGATFGGAPTELWNPQATSFVTAGNQFEFNITGPTNATIVVEACTNLANPVWLPVSTNTLSGSGTSSFNDPQRGNFPTRYYTGSARRDRFAPGPPRMRIAE